MPKTYSPWNEGNVAFASAMDGWALTGAVCEIIRGKVGMFGESFEKGLWGDWFYHPKSKRIVGKKLNPNGKLKPLLGTVHSRSNLETV